MPLAPPCRILAPESWHKVIKLSDGVSEALILAPSPLEQQETNEGISQQQDDLPAGPCPFVFAHQILNSVVTIKGVEIGKVTDFVIIS